MWKNEEDKAFLTSHNTPSEPARETDSEQRFCEYCGKFKKEQCPNKDDKAKPNKDTLACPSFESKPYESDQFEEKKPKEINPVVLAKAIKGFHTFIVEENSRQLYVYSPKDGCYSNHAEDLIKTEIVRRLNEDARSRFYPDVYFYIYGIAPVEPFNDNPELLICENGILDTVKRELSPFTPKLFITSKVPVTYDPKASCPAINKFLLEVLGEKQIRVFQEMVGYTLYRRMIFHKAGLFVGSGANGKSTTLELIKNFLGKNNCSANTIQDICFNRFSLAVMHDKLANICADLPSKKLEHTGKFKQIVGGDTVNAEYKNKMPFPFVNVAKLLFSCNSIPPIAETEDCYAFFRRWIILEFNNMFDGEKADKHQLKKLTTPSELGGFLNFALDGLKRLLENADFSINETVEQMRKQYIKRSDSVKAFIEENVIVTNEYSDWIEIGQLYKAFVKYCQKEKIATVPQRVFTEDMKEHCVGADYKVHRLTKEELEHGSTKKQIHVWSYIKLKNVTDVTDVQGKPNSTLPEYAKDSIKTKNIPSKNPEIYGELATPLTSVTSVTEPSSERVCGQCVSWHKPSCSYPDADPNCVVPTNKYAEDCRTFNRKVGVNHD